MNFLNMPLTYCAFYVILYSTLGKRGFVKMDSDDGDSYCNTELNFYLLYMAYLRIIYKFRRRAFLCLKKVLI